MSGLTVAGRRVLAVGAVAVAVAGGAGWTAGVMVTRADEPTVAGCAETAAGVMAPPAHGRACTYAGNLFRSERSRVAGGWETIAYRPLGIGGVTDTVWQLAPGGTVELLHPDGEVEDVAK